MTARWKQLLLGYLLWAGTALAQPDVFGLGTGRDQLLVVTEPRTVINRYTRLTAPVSPGDSEVHVSSTDGFAAGDLVMVLQTAALRPGPWPTSGPLLTLGEDSVGQWELARLSAAQGQELKLTEPLQRRFAAVGAQVIRIPEYTDVQVWAGASLVAAPWDGSTGGVLAFLARGTIHNEGALEASGAGFRGGRAVPGAQGSPGCVALPLAARPGGGRGEGLSSQGGEAMGAGSERVDNGGGGGLCPASGGGGGGHGGPGGQGAGSLDPLDALGASGGGQGGAGLSLSRAELLAFGGGGGQGYAQESVSPAGAGGGVIYIRAYRLVGGGTVAADGEVGTAATQGGAGGGGAGGTVSVRVIELLEGNRLSAQGGAGGSALAGMLAYAGPGGGGGGGRIVYEARRAPSFMGTVEAGLAGVGQLVSAWAEPSLQAQPSASLASAYRGTITRLAETLAGPDAQIISAPPNPSNSPTAIFEFSSPQQGSGFDCRLDTMDYPNCTSPWTTPVTLSEGPHGFQVRAKLGGNTGAAATHNWVVDLTPPDTTITDQPNNPSNTPNATFTFASTEVGGSFDCRLEATAYPNCTTPFSFSNLPNGSYTFEVRAKDAAGNPDPTPSSYSWVINTPPPDTTITSHPSNPSNVRRPRFEFQGSAATGFDCRLDTTDIPDCSSPWSPTADLNEGPHGFQVSAKDSAGNRDPTPASYNWVIDITAPDTSITSQPANPTNSTSATFNFSGTGGAVGFNCNLDGTAYPDCSSPWTAPVALIEGTHRFQVSAKDLAGNVDPSPATYDWTVDRTPPVTVIDLRPSNPSNLSDFTFTFSGAGANGTYMCNLDLGGDTACDSGSYAASGLEEGAHTFCVYATDAATNRDLTPECYSWSVDLTAPDTVIGPNRPSNPTTSTVANFTFTGAGAGGKYWCTLDEGARSACDTGSVGYTGLTEGTHRFCVAAQDRAGNEDESPACYTWVVDLTPPDTVIAAASKPPNPSASTAATFTFTGAGPQGRYWCNLDGEGEVSCDTGSMSYTALAEGSRTFCVASQDAAGNRDLTPDCYTWVVDLTLPDTVIEEASKPPNPTNSTSANFRFSGAESGGRYECALDNGAVEACNSGRRDYTVLSEGNHVFCVRAVDSAGNRDPDPECYAWTIDLTPPDTVITESSKPRNPTNVTTVTFQFSGAEAGGHYWCKLDSQDADYVSCDLGSKAYTGLTERVHTFYVFAVDAAGNRDEATPATYTWQVDITRPDTTIVESSKPPDPTNNTSATFLFEGAEAGGSYTCKLDNGPNEPCNEGVRSYNALPEGPHTFSVYATDAAGNVDLQPATYSWVVDLTPPETVIQESSKPPNPTNATTARFSFSDAGDRGSYRCKLNNAPEETCNSGFKEYQGLGDATHRFCVYAVDAAGNPDSSPDCYEWRVDITPPDTTLLEPGRPRNPTNETSATFTFTGSGEPVSYWCTLDSILPQECTTGNYTRSGLGEGSHQFCVYSRDGVGNNDTSPACYTWVIDLTPPDTIIEPDSKPRSPTNSREATFRFSGAGEGGKYICRLDGGSEQSCDSGTRAYTGLPEGRRTFSVAAVDAAGNRDSTPDSYSWDVDLTPPETVIDPSSKPEPDTNALTLTFRFEGAGERGGYWCRLDNNPYVACDSGSQTYSGQAELPEGNHSFSVYAQDEAGNIDSSADIYHFRIDRTSPVTTVKLPVLAPGKLWRTNQTSPPLTGECSEAQSTVFLSINDDTAEEVTPAGNDGKWGLTTRKELRDGTHTVKARAVDKARNAGVFSEAVPFIVDTVPPETVIASKPAQVHDSRLVVFKFEAPTETEPEDLITTFTCKLKSLRYGKESVTNCTAEQLYNLATLFDITDVNGAYSIEATAVDEAGNLDPTPAVYDWDVVVDPPESPEISSPQEGETVYELTPTVSGTGARNGTVELFLGEGEEKVRAGLTRTDAQGTFSLPLPNQLEEGTYVLTAVTTDAAGNPSPSSPPRSFTVLKPKPQGQAIGGGLGCASSSAQPGLALLGLAAVAAWSGRRRRGAGRWPLRARAALRTLCALFRRGRRARVRADTGRVDPGLPRGWRGGLHLGRGALQQAGPVAHRGVEARGGAAGQGLPHRGRAGSRLPAGGGAGSVDAAGAVSAAVHARSGPRDPLP